MFNIYIYFFFFCFLCSVSVILYSLVVYILCRQLDGAHAVFAIVWCSAISFSCTLHFIRANIKRTRLVLFQHTMADCSQSLKRAIYGATAAAACCCCCCCRRSRAGLNAIVANGTFRRPINVDGECCACGCDTHSNTQRRILTVHRRGVDLRSLGPDANHAKIVLFLGGGI